MSAHFSLCRDLPDLPAATGRMIWQQKVDGVRAFVSEKRIQLRTTQFRNAGFITPVGCVLDGEIVADTGRFSDVMPAIMRNDFSTLRFIPFDIVQTERGDVRNANLLQRLNMLNSRVDNALRIFAFPDQPMPKVPERWEGVIGKPEGSTYRAGRTSWVKWKRTGFIDAYILGYKNGKGIWADSVGSVIFGTRDGTVLGTAAGFDAKTRNMLTLNGADYIGKPCVIKHYGLNKRRLRNPLFHGIKE